MPRLSGNSAFITGGGTGIGRACALAFAAEGAKVAIAGRRKGPLEAVAREIEASGGIVLAVECDVVDRTAVQSAIATVERHFGGLDILVNNAGAIVVGSVEETSDEDWSRVLEINMTGTFLVSRAAIPALRRSGGGSIINIGSYLGIAGRRQRAAYCAAKAGVAGLTRGMALDHAPDKIRVRLEVDKIRYHTGQDSRELYMSRDDRDGDGHSVAFEGCRSRSSAQAAHCRNSAGPTRKTRGCGVHGCVSRIR